MEVFQRLKVIGKGSYGEVWLALHTVDRKQYVLKKMELRNASRRERKAAEQEAKLLSKLKHPNIVAYKDSFETDDGLLWIAMGYCEGGDLYTYLKSRKGALLDERQIVEWFVQISMALQYLHERNVLHRDLKTQNIFLTRSRIIKVGDLGIARVLDSESDMATTLIGTPYYMSPELFANKPYNHKSDVWALGCCVHEMATLRHAFNAKDMNSLVYKILRGRTPPMPDQYSHDLADLVKAMLNQNPARRPSVAKILRDPYIRKNIAIFLEGTKNRSRRPASSGGDQPPSSARSAVSGSSSSSRSSVGRKPLSPAEELPVRGAPRDLDTITEVSLSEVDRTGSSQPQQRGSSGGSSSSRRGSAGPSRAASDALPLGNEGARSVPAPTAALRNGAAPSPRPRQTDAAPQRATPPSSADKARALPTVSSAPSIASRQRGSDGGAKPMAASPARRSADDPEDGASYAGEPLSARSGSEPSLSSTNPNLQARARRREKKSQTADLTHPSAVPAAPAAAASAGRQHDAQQQQHSAAHPTPARAERVPERRAHQPTAAAATAGDEDDGGVGEEEAATESAESVDGAGGGDGPQAAAAAAADKDMAKLTTLLDATLNMQPDIEDEEDDAGAGEEEEEEDGDDPTLVEPSQPDRLAADRRAAGGRATAASAAASPAPRPTPTARAALPAFGKETLGSTTRLNDRIAALHRDCVRGVGFERLHKAYQILNGFEDDEVEARLRELLDGDLFDEYAGKIWQLKFCEESAFGR